MFVSTKWIAVAVSASVLIYAAHAQDSAARKELKRGDLTGTNMEVVISISEIKPGETLARHFHHGEEAFYILEGATAELPDGKQIPLPTGVASIIEGKAADIEHRSPHLTHTGSRRRNPVRRGFADCGDDRACSRIVSDAECYSGPPTSGCLT